MTAEYETALYRLYAADGALLYIGITWSLARRMRQHAAQQQWWGEVARRTVVWYPSRQLAAVAETAAIRAEHPTRNRQHNRPVPQAAVLIAAERWERGEYIEIGPGVWRRQFVPPHPWPWGWGREPAPVPVPPGVAYNITRHAGTETVRWKVAA